MSSLEDPGNVRVMLTQLLRDPTLYPDEFKAWLTGWTEVNPPTLPFDQIVGFPDYQIRNVLEPDEITVAGGKPYVTRGGPIMTDVPEGKYLVTYGGTGHGDASQRIALMVDSAMPDDDIPDCVRWDSTEDQTHTGQAIVDVKNEIEVVYRGPIDGSTLYFSARILTAQRVSQ